MKNWKPGMRVYHFLQMNRPGVITELKRIKNGEWLTAGTSQERLLATVQHDDGEVSSFWASDLRSEE